MTTLTDIVVAQLRRQPLGRYRQRGEMERLAGLLPPLAGGSVPGPGYSYPFGTAAEGVEVTTTAKTVIAITGDTQNPFNIAEYAISSDQTTGALIVEICWGDGAGAGTSTAVTPVQMRGPGQEGKPRATAGANFTVEPTTLTVAKTMRLPMPSTPYVSPKPLGREPSQYQLAATAGKPGKVFVLRVRTSTGTAHVTGWVEIEE